MNDPVYRNGLASPCFDVAVPHSGYRWWYLDGLSDCGRYGIVIIAFIGSVFSPYYRWARRRGPADPYDHCAINVALYLPKGKRWAMTERGRGSVACSPATLRVGPSGLDWQAGALRVDVTERSAPLGRPVRGHVTLRPLVGNHRVFSLDDGGRHEWQPLAPRARIAVDFSRPVCRWTGDGYFDTNGGSRSLEDDFRDWYWSRSHRAGMTQIGYHVRQHGRAERPMTLGFGDDGDLVTLASPERIWLPRSRWGIRRPARCDGATRVRRTLEDAPFYARSEIVAEPAGQPAVGVHESLSLTRFVTPWVQFMLPFRMPRALRQRPPDNV